MALQSFALADPTARADQPAPETIARSEDASAVCSRRPARGSRHRVRGV